MWKRYYFGLIEKPAIFSNLFCILTKVPGINIMVTKPG